MKLTGNMFYGLGNLESFALCTGTAPEKPWNLVKPDVTRMYDFMDAKYSVDFDSTEAVKALEDYANLGTTILNFRLLGFFNAGMTLLFFGGSNTIFIVNLEQPYALPERIPNSRVSWVDLSALSGDVTFIAAAAFMAVDGTYIDIINGHSTYLGIHRFPLTTAYDLTTLGSSTEILNLETLAGYPNTEYVYGAALCMGRTKAIVRCATNMVELTLSTPGDFSTATVAATVPVGTLAGKTAVSYGLYVTEDASSVFFFDGSYYLEVPLGTAGDITTYQAPVYSPEALTAPAYNYLYGTIELTPRGLFVSDNYINGLRKHPQVRAKISAPNTLVDYTADVLADVNNRFKIVTHTDGDRLQWQGGDLTKIVTDPAGGTITHAVMLFRGAYGTHTVAVASVTATGGGGDIELASNVVAENDVVEITSLEIRLNGLYSV